MCNNELKPCPFCGGEAIIEAQDGGQWTEVLCKEGCLTKEQTLGEELHREKAITAWNTRVKSGDV